MMKKITTLLKGTRMETGNPIPISMKGTKGTQFFSSATADNQNVHPNPLPNKVCLRLYEGGGKTNTLEK